MWRPEEVAKQVVSFHDLSEHDIAYALRYLRYYGYLKADNPTPEHVINAATDFQTAYGIQTDGLLGRQTLEAMWAPRCGVRDDAFTLPARWRKHDLTWYVDQYIEGVPGLSKLDQDDLQIQDLREYESVIDVKWSRASSRNTADLIVGVGEGQADQFDGPGGVLAWCQIPQGSDRPILMKFDKGDNWIRSVDLNQRGIVYPNVDKHEKGHGHGMLHISGKPALLNAFYSPSVGKLLDADKEALLALGYAKATPPPPPPPPVDAQTITLQITGKVVGASIPGFRIIPLQ